MQNFIQLSLNLTTLFHGPLKCSQPVNFHFLLEFLSRVSILTRDIDLEIWLRGHSISLKLVPFKRKWNSCQFPGMMLSGGFFHFHRWEAVKELICFCGELDFVHMYNLCRWKFLNNIHVNFPYGATLLQYLAWQRYSIFWVLL